MSRREPSGPDLAGVVADANAVALPYVVIGGFSVIANGYLRATKDSDLLVPDGDDADAAIHRFLGRVEGTRLHDSKELEPADIAGADHIRVESRHGLIDIIRGGKPPLDFETVAERSVEIDVDGRPAQIADLRSIVGFKRLSGRPHDLNDLEELEAFHGELPIEPIPGVDT